MKNMTNSHLPMKRNKSQTHEKMCSILTYQGNADQSRNDVLFTLTRMAEIEKTECNKCAPRLSATETLLH